MTAINYLLEVKANIPANLCRLPSLSKDIIYSWKEPIRDLFIRLDRRLWEDCGHNPSIFLRRIEQRLLDRAAADPDYLRAYENTVQWYDRYLLQQINPDLKNLLNPDKDLIAYFCSEFGFHESLPIYSGGLGILAGDHCKAANDMSIPFVAVGLLYHQGYFTQTIDPDGNQVSTNVNHYFGHLPITLVKDAAGNELRVELKLSDRHLALRLWQAKIGRVQLLLLDSDIDANNEEDRLITRQLYGNGFEIRIKQEIVLGIGGVMALRALDLQPNIWHINEGHAAFQILERCREWVNQGVAFDTALELVAGCTVFTTHTPVAAGHDSFNHETMSTYFRHMAESMAITIDTLLPLGHTNDNHSQFNMTAFALRGSRFHNGVSDIHGGIASSMESYIWPQVPPEENPITSITNGVHVTSILAKKWANIFDQQFDNWSDSLLEPDYWQRIDAIPDAIYWSTHQELKTSLLKDVCHRLDVQHKRNGSSRALQEASICRIKSQSNDILVLGFARRFATYKRATLLLSDLDRLSKILNDPGRPVIILFAGKAHPDDKPGQQLIKDIHLLSERAEFVGKIILLEGYDLNLARYMIAGTDIWLNTPTYPLEACGTSGQKAAINGVVNLSIMDGWWAEGFNGKNGWGIEPHSDKYGSDYRNQQEASDLLDVIEKEVIPAYFERDNSGIPSAWLSMSKESMKSCIPHFCAQRMLMDYIEKMYVPAKQQNLRLTENNRNGAELLVKWKKHIRHCWPGLTARIIDQSAIGICYGETLSITLGIHLNGLAPEDVVVECIRGHENSVGDFQPDGCFQFSTHTDTDHSEGETLYTLQMKPENSGIYRYQLRIYPFSELLAHKFEMGCMLWL